MDSFHCSELSELLPGIDLLLYAWHIYSHLLRPVSLTCPQLATTSQRAAFILSSKKVLRLHDGCAHQHLQKISVSREDSGLSVWHTACHRVFEPLLSTPSVAPTGKLPISLAWIATPPAHQGLRVPPSSPQEPE